MFALFRKLITVSLGMYQNIIHISSHVSILKVDTQNVRSFYFLIFIFALHLNTNLMEVFDPISDQQGDKDNPT